MDQFDPWQVVLREVFTPCSRLLISTAFDVVSRVGCLKVTGVDSFAPLYMCVILAVCMRLAVYVTKLQIKGGIEDNSKITFLTSQRKHML